MAEGNTMSDSNCEVIMTDNDVLSQLKLLSLEKVVPKYMVRELASLLYDGVEIAHAINLKTNRVLGYIAVICLVLLTGLVVRGAVVSLIFIVILYPLITKRCIVISNLAIFFCPPNGFGSVVIVPVQEIASIRIVKDKLLIETEDKNYSFYGFRKQKLDDQKKTIEAITLLLEENNIGVQNGKDS